jgi:two-component system, chemotaxis family, chemotaxis protein CheY
VTGSILLVEDDEAIRESLAEFLEGEGFRVVAVQNGKEAVDQVVLGHNEPPCLILLDLMMPVMSGKQFLAARQVATHLREIPVVILSAWIDRSQGAVGRADGSIPKPIDTEKLLQIVRLYCGGSSTP